MAILIQNIFFFIFLYFVSNFFFFKLKLPSISKSIYGLSFFAITINIFYFFLGLKFQYIFYFYIFFFILSLFFIKKKILKDLLIQFKFLFLILFLFLIIIFFLDLQHYIFRGNAWDSFTYLSQGLLINNFSALEIANLNNIYNFNEVEFFYMKYADQLYSRPLVGFIIAFFANVIIFDPLELAFSFKIFSTILTLLSLKFFFERLKVFDNKNIFILSYGFVLSHFYFYNYEIDAFSLILSFPFFFILLGDVGLFFDSIKKKDNIYFIRFVIISSGFFIIYPNSAIIFLFIFFLYFLVCLIVNNELNLNNIRFLSKFLFLFIILILPSYKSTIMYLIEEARVGILHKVDYWGYYGAFALGKDVPIYNTEIIQSFKKLWLSEPSLYSLFKKINEINFSVGNIYYILNIIPSIFGFFHLTTSNNYDYLNYILILILFFLNINILKQLINIFQFGLRYNKNIKFFFYIASFFYLIFSIYLILKSQYWSLIKLFFFFSPFFYLCIALNFKNIIKPNLFIIFFLMLLPFYKYSNFNYGIGVLDSYPSVMKTRFKQNVKWNINKDALKKCGKIDFKESDYFTRLYISIKFDYLKRKDKKTINNKSNNCIISIKDTIFVINK